MRRVGMAVAGLVAAWLLAGPAGAQTTAAGEVIVKPLPLPMIDEDAPPAAFLAAAKAALGGARFDEAMEALERAESRALIRSVRPSLAGTPSTQPLVVAIGAARRALEAGDRAGCLARIAEASALPEASQ